MMSCLSHEFRSKETEVSGPELVLLRHDVFPKKNILLYRSNEIQTENFNRNKCTTVSVVFVNPEVEEDTL